MQVIPGIDLWGNFAVSARGIYFGPPEKGEILYFDFSSRRMREVAKIDKPLQFGLSATADGQFIISTQTDRENDELLVVEDFR